MLLRFSLGVLGLICCARFIEDASRTGVSRLFSAAAIIESRIEAADEAVRLAPSDPEAHYTRALALVNLERLSEAVVEFQHATRLRPHHYYEWLDLGVTLERLGDQSSAEAALRESVRLAPFFAQPRWQLGNLLYRQGRYDEAFAELRLGVKSNPSLTDELLGLAWLAANGDGERIEALVQPTSKRSHLELANFLAKRGNGPGTIMQVREAGQPGDEVERALLRSTISGLLTAQLFPDAYAAWAMTHHAPAVPMDTPGSGRLLNGDFVEPILRDDLGFDWQAIETPKVVVSVDSSGPAPGARSVRVEFGGDNAPETELIHQLILVRPKSRYSLSFMARAENLLSGGPPVILILDASSNPAKILAQSKPLSPGTKEWTAYQVDFNTQETTPAIILGLRRLSCSQTPCPIFGKLWLSRFSLIGV